MGLGAALLAFLLILVLTLAPAPADTQTLTNVQPALLAMAETQPDATVRVIVHKANADSALEGLATELGGTAVKDLHLINALAVELPAKAISTLARSDSVAQISLDGTMMSASILTETIADNFNVRVYSNNTGTQSWASDWFEINDDDKVDGGKVKIDKDLLKLEDRNRGIQRSADLSDAATATLTFQYRREKFNKGKAVNIEISTDGGANWNQVVQINGDVNESTFQSASFDISAYAGGPVILRFLSGPVGDGKLWVDNLQIEYTIDSAPPPLPEEGGDGGASPIIHTIRDEFNANDYTGSDGTDAWVGNWIEDEQSDINDQNPAAGWVQVENGALRLNNQKVAVHILERLGYRADVAANGVEVLEALTRQPYDVVLMDVQMPEMDGVEAAQQIKRKWHPLERPYIIAMTADALAGDRERYLAAGMDDYISKPVPIKDLMSALYQCQPVTANIMA